MRTTILIAFLVLTGCVTAPKVAPVGKDTYIVTASNDACGNFTLAEIRAANEASSYRAAQGKTSTVIKTETQTFDLGYGHRIFMTFSCDAR